MTDTLDPELPDVVDLVVERVLERIRGSEIGRVTRFDETTGTASVQPVVQRRHLDETGQVVSRSSSELHEIPVLFLGAGPARLTAAPQPGDYGLIVFSSVSTARWKRRGGIVDPADDRRHWEDDAVFIPGLSPMTARLTPVPKDLTLHAGSGVVRVGAPAGTQRTLLASSFLSALDDLLDAVKVAIAGITSVSGGGPAATAIETAIGVFQAGPLRTAYQSSLTEVK